MTTEEMISVMQHFVNGGDVQVKANNIASYWVDQPRPTWDWPAYDYRIRPAEPKKVKLLAYLINGGLSWLTEGYKTHDDWIRVPSEDKEITLPEGV